MTLKKKKKEGRKEEKTTTWIQYKIGEPALLEVEKNGQGVPEFGEGVSCLTVNEMFKNSVFI